MTLVGSRVALVVGALFVLVAEREAAACGGFFTPPPKLADAQAAETASVTGQQWVYAVSPTRSVLYVQLAYTGTTSEYAWILPVRGAPEIGVGKDALFDALASVTAVRVKSPTLWCAGERPKRTSGCLLSCLGGCGSAGGSAGPAREMDGAAEGIEVLGQESAGPYDTVTVRSTTPTALFDWLAQNGFFVPDHVKPAITDYANAGWDFLAVRVRPGTATRLAPIRVVFPGIATTIPVRLATAGAPGRLPVTLYVVAEGRYGLRGWEERSIAARDIVWDWRAGDSNYSALRQAALGTPKTALFVWAARRGLTEPADIGEGDPAILSKYPAILSEYQKAAGVLSCSAKVACDNYLRCIQNCATNSCERTCELQYPEGARYYETCPSPSLSANRQVVEHCPAADGGAPPPSDAGADAAANGGNASVTGRVSPPSLGIQSSQGAADLTCGGGVFTKAQIACGDAKDVAELLVGMHILDTWVTRLDFELDRGMTEDLELQPAAVQRQQGTRYVAGAHTNVPCDVEPDGSAPLADAQAGMGIGLFGWWRLRRRKPRTRSRSRRA